MEITKKIIVLFLLLAIVTSCKKTNPEDYLKEVLANLEAIESITYYDTREAWQPGDTAALFIFSRLVEEFDNPKDTTIGVSFVSFEYEDTLRLDFGYNGEVKLTPYHEHKGIMIDDFTYNDLPFRPISTPFFNKAKNIISYMLTTEDSITVESEELADQYYYKLTVHEDRQVEFMGKARYIPEPPFERDPTSIYEIWINKSSSLPEKVRREMAHDISVVICREIVAMNDKSIDDLDLYAYIPADYEIRQYKPRNNDMRSSSNLIGVKAPDWTLNDMNEQPVSLSDSKSKVLLLNFTGIGCGPCQVAIPFLAELKNSYSRSDLDIIAIECWGRTPHSMRIYADRHEMNYNMLAADDDLLSAYETGRGVPVFFILDENRIVSQVFTGYNQETTGDMIRNEVSELLKKQR